MPTVLKHLIKVSRSYSSMRPLGVQKKKNGSGDVLAVQRQKRAIHNSFDPNSVLAARITQLAQNTLPQEFLLIQLETLDGLLSNPTKDLMLSLHLSFWVNSIFLYGFTHGP